MKKIKVLLVDDHPVLRMGIRRLLEQDEQILVIGEADSAEEALEKMNAQPEVVLMDIKLPGLNGIEATRQIVAGHPGIKVIILSAYGSEYLEQAIEAGARGYILKTAAQFELVHAVHQAAQGQTPIDSNLTTTLLDRFAKLWRMSRDQGLSCRQLQALRMVADGVPSKEIAARLAISDATFKRDIKAIFIHLGVTDRPQAVSEAYNRQLL